MNKKLKTTIKYILSTSVAAVLLWLSFRGMDWKEFLEGLESTSWTFIFLSMLAATAALWFRAERWRMQLHMLDPDISRAGIWHGSNIGNFISLVLPGVGEFVRCVEVSTRKAGYSKTFGTIVVERMWDVIAIIVITIIAVVLSAGTLGPFMKEHVIDPLLGGRSLTLWLALALVVLIAAAVIFLIWKFRNRSRICRKCVNILKSVVKGMDSFRKMPGKGLFLLYTVGIWTMYILMTWFTLLAIPELRCLSFTDSVFLSALGNFASVIPTPGNLGPYHYLVGLAISSIYLGASGILPVAMLCATLSHGSHALLVIILGAGSYIRKAFI